MLKLRELHEAHALYDLMKHPDVLPYVRHKAYSTEQYLFMTKHIMDEELEGRTISRTITNDWGQPIGTISLFDIDSGAGFLGTWLGKPYHGQGHNQQAKDAFLKELFFQHNFHTVFLRIRQENIGSQKAALKLPYVLNAQLLHPTLFEEINQGEAQYKLFKIPKDLFYFTMMHYNTEEEEQAI